jgi:hypothetical protein
MRGRMRSPLRKAELLPPWPHTFPYPKPRSLPRRTVKLTCLPLSPLIPPKSLRYTCQSPCRVELQSGCVLAKKRCVGADDGQWESCFGRHDARLDGLGRSVLQWAEDEIGVVRACTPRCVEMIVSYDELGS